jgi:hypothetical protein
MTGIRTSYSISPGTYKGKEHLSDLAVYGAIMPKIILKKHDVKIVAEFIWLRIGSSGGLL